MAHQETSETHTDYRAGVGQVPYQGPDRPTKKTRTKRILIGLGVFLVVGIIATLFVFGRSVH